MKIIFLTDIHYSSQVIGGTRKGEYGDIFLLRAVNRINRFIKPDIVVIGGDIINDGDSELLKKILPIINKIEAPTITLQGNHDCDEKTFYEIIPQPPEYIDFKQFRIIPFIDELRPNDNAYRNEKQIQRMKSLTESFDGIPVYLHHIPVFNDPNVECPYNYLNSSEVIKAMKKGYSNIVLSGHYHRGFITKNQSFGVTIAAQALTEAPFIFCEIIIPENSKNPIKDIEVIQHSLAMPEEYALHDYHIHTHFAYCSENMDVTRTCELAELFNIETISLSEHTAHLYASRKEYSSKKVFNYPNYTPDNDRTDIFFHEVKNFKNSKTLIGFEADCSFTGFPILKTEHRSKADIILGAIHAIPEECAGSLSDTINFYKTIMPKFLSSGIEILAHPFRIFKRYELTTPANELYPFLVKLLKENGVAAEINFHTNEPDIEFFNMCVENNVQITFGSDAHNLYEIGEFYPHLNFVNQIYGKNIPERFLNNIKIFDTRSGH